jgi:cystathionine beta-synthase
LGRLAKDVEPAVYAKLEHMNPGGSVKDRIAISMIDAAERDEHLRPGGTIIEGTSGNTGMGLALVAAVRGYKLIFTITDKQSREKIDLLKGLGAEVIVCPTAVTPDDPRSYYSIAKKLSQEIPNSFYPNQYDNPNNPQAHYDATGPEIWESSEGKVTHFVVGMGTGGTATGIGRYLKSQNPNVKIIGVDPVGSLYHEFFHTGKVGEPLPYVVEGIGEDLFPKNVDFSLLDDVIQVTDRDCFLTARHLARQEGIFAGGSAGGAVWAALRVARSLSADDFVVVFIPDTGRQYVSKIYNDEWMRENRYVESAVRLTAGEC